MEKAISKIYADSQAAVVAEWDEYMDDLNDELRDVQKAYESAKRSGDKDEIAKTKKELQEKEREQTIFSRNYKKMVAAVALRMAGVNRAAINYTNKQLPSIYVVNYNAIAKDAVKVGVDFTLVNQNTIKTLKKKTLNVAKDVRWNTKQINSQVLQGIQRGESIPKIAQRIMPIVDNNEAAAIRTARTTVTYAENRGRLESYMELEDEGVVIKKVWIATPDDRTREWHLDMDGQEVDLDDVFIDGNGNPLDQPGDPNAEPETVYNCRCGMEKHIIGIRRDDGTIDRFDDYGRSSLHEDEIEEEKERRRDES